MPPEPSPAHPKAIHKILLYGNSILIAGLISKLAQVQDWDVSQVQDGCIGDVSGVDVIAFDVHDNNIADALPRLHGLPGIALVGLDALTDTVIVSTGHSHPAHSMQDVLDVLKNAL